MKKFIISKEIKKDSKIIDLLNDQKIKDSNFKFIHEKFMNENESSFSNEIESLKELFKDRKIEEFQMIMIHRESRKIYYLFIHDIMKDEIHFIMKNDSIMKNKIFLMKMIQFFDHKEMKIHYIKNDRKNQSSEIISKDSREYKEKIQKYSMI